MSEYLEFNQIPYEGKTKRFNVVSKLHGDILGRISWYGAWRQYTFSPTYPTVWNNTCLKDIINFLEQLMKEYKHE